MRQSKRCNTSVRKWPGRAAELEYPYDNCRADFNLEREEEYVIYTLWTPVPIYNRKRGTHSVLPGQRPGIALWRVMTSRNSVRTHVTRLHDTVDPCIISPFNELALAAKIGSNTRRRRTLKPCQTKAT